jgi:NosR/NirI family nitrous oxide reductase transcriptional regulator
MEEIVMKKNLLLTISAFAVSSNIFCMGQSPAMAAATTTTNKTTVVSTTTATKKIATTNKKYKDGVYKASATGYRGHGYNGITTVAVTLKKDKITRVKITSIGDTPEFYETPVEYIPKAIIKAQSTNVDVVSGATFSSRGIINAVSAALKKAKI